MQNNGAALLRRTLGEAKELNLGLHEEKGEMFSVLATITNIAHSQERPPWYKAAPDERKGNKVEPDGRGQYYCQKLNKTFATYVPRYVIRFCVSDFSGQQWFNAFDESATKILQKTAREAEQMLEEGRVAEYEAIFSNACFKRYIFQVNAKAETYQEERRLRYAVVSVQPVDPVSEAKELISKISLLHRLKNQ